VLARPLAQAQVGAGDWPSSLAQWDSAAASLAAAAGAAADGTAPAPLPWLSALVGSAAGSASGQMPLLDVSFSSAAAAAAAAAARVAAPDAGASSPRLALAFTSSNANLDLSAPSLALGATLSVTSPSFLSRALFVLLAPYVRSHPMPIAVQTLLPVVWRSATPSGAPGAYTPGPPRTSTVWSSVECGQAGASAVLDPASGALVASALFSLPNARGCLNHVLRELRLGAFAGLPASEAVVRTGSDAGRPRGSLSIALPGLGVFSFPLPISTRLWLSSSSSGSAGPVDAQVVFSALPHAASSFPSVYMLTAPDAAAAASAVVFGASSHSPGVVAALDAALASGCGAAAPAQPALCTGFEAAWQSSQYLGFAGMVLSGLCRDPADDSLCIAATWSSDAFGLLNFEFAPGKSGYADLIANSPELKTHPTWRVPLHTSFTDHARTVSYVGAGLLAWGVQSAPSAPYVGFNLTAAVLYAMANVSLAGRPASERPGFPASIASFTLPRVPAAECSALIVPAPGSPGAALAATGFSAIHNEECTRAALSPLVDLGMDYYVKQPCSCGEQPYVRVYRCLSYPYYGCFYDWVPGPRPPCCFPSDPVKAALWVLFRPASFLLDVQAGVESLLRGSYDSSGAPFPGTSSVAKAYTSAVVDYIKQGLSWAVNAVLWVTPIKALEGNGVLDKATQLAARPVDHTARPSGLGVARVRGSQTVLLGTDVLGSVDFSALLSASGALSFTLNSQTLAPQCDSFAALRQIFCALQNASQPRPLPLLAYGTLAALDRTTGATVSTPTLLDLGALLAFADATVAALLPFAWPLSLPVTEATVYGVRRYAINNLFTSYSNSSCPSLALPAPSASPLPAAAAAASAPAGAACSSAAACASGACNGGFCCSATAAQMGCRSCQYGTGSCALYSPGEACGSSYDCGTNLCLGGCCCAASAVLSVGCTACQCWGGSSGSVNVSSAAAATAATAAATAGACTANPSMTLTLPCNASVSLPSAAALSRVISFGNLSVGADPLLLLPAVAPLNTWGGDVILASAPACATFAAQAGGTHACSASQSVYVSAAGVPYYYLGSAGALAMVAAPACAA
jgi:hypothetical protein